MADGLQTIRIYHPWQLFKVCRIRDFYHHFYSRRFDSPFLECCSKELIINYFLIIILYRQNLPCHYDIVNFIMKCKISYAKMVQMFVELGNHSYCDKIFSASSVKHPNYYKNWYFKSSADH